eukprot:scaffold17121_cov64-Phaeocystis_antarctica.AAC.1
MVPALRLAVLRLVRTSATMLKARTSSPSMQGDSTRKSNWLKKEPSCRQFSGRPNASMLRCRTSKTLSNAATDAGIATLKTLSTRAAICAVQAGKRPTGDHLLERSPKLLQGLINHVAQALAWLAPAAPAEKEENGQCDAYKSCQRRCRCVPALHARRLTRVKVPRAIGDVADSAVRPGGPWLAEHTICIRARRRVWRGRIGAAPQIVAAIVRAPVPRYQGKQSQSSPRSLAIGPDRAWLARHIASSGVAVVVPFLTFAVFDACRVFTRLGRPGALLARTSRNSVGAWLVGVDSTRNRQASATPCHTRRHA